MQYMVGWAQKGLNERSNLVVDNAAVVVVGCAVNHVLYVAGLTNRPIMSMWHNVWRKTVCLGDDGIIDFSEF